jgi:hypothetical protein
LVVVGVDLDPAFLLVVRAASEALDDHASERAGGHTRDVRGCHLHRQPAVEVPVLLTEHLEVVREGPRVGVRGCDRLLVFLRWQVGVPPVQVIRRAGHGRGC